MDCVCPVACVAPKERVFRAQPPMRTT